MAFAWLREQNGFMARHRTDHTDQHEEHEGPVEIAFIGELTDSAAELSDKLLSVPPAGECTIYFDSPGGSAYTAISLMTMIVVRGIHATGIVTGECSSAALWPFAACQRRIVTPYSVLLFHPMKWQSEEHVLQMEAAEWARHFSYLEKEMDLLLARFFNISAEQLSKWSVPGRYLTGHEIAEAGLAEMHDLTTIPALFDNHAARTNRVKRRAGAKA
jgi:ATP-dependent protease ClpP protease subunit